MHATLCKPDRHSALTEVICHGRKEGRPQEMCSHYTDDWVKVDCGAIKPFDANAAMNRTPPSPP